MDIGDFVFQYGGWSWVVLGFILLAVELFVPGGVFVWMGISAIVVGIATLGQLLGWQLQWILFAVFSIAGIVVWTVWIKHHIHRRSENSFLNARNEKLAGQIFTLDAAIVDGAGQLKIDDSRWRITGPDLPVGTRVRVAAVDVTILRVEALEEN